MNRLGAVVAATIAGLALAACATAAPVLPTPIPPATATTAAAPAANGAAPAGTRVGGTVQSFTGGTVTLADGTSFTVSDTTRVTHSVAVTLTDLQVGDVVAITATKQADGTLLATIVNVFPLSLKANIPQLQRPIPNTSNLMTNGTINQVANGGFSVTYPNGTAQITLAPGATVSKSTDGTQADIKVGSKVTGFVNNGAARTLTIQ